MVFFNIYISDSKVELEFFHMPSFKYISSYPCPRWQK